MECFQYCALSGRHQFNLTELENAAKKACPACTLILTCVECYVRPHYPEVIQDIRRDMEWSELTRALVWNGFFRAEYAGDGGPQLGPLLDVFQLREDIEKIPHEVAVPKILPGRTDSMETFRTITGWLENCRVNHSHCKHIAASRTLQSPKRILDLRGGSIKLCEDLDLQVYACLSHCWGSAADMVKTTTVNLDDFKLEITLQALPKTFQDAIEICRRLDVHFLWIDSLCIIQDSEEDWKEQAARMAGIYENASFTIAATWAPDSSQGCFSRTNPIYMAKPVEGYSGLYIRHEPPSIPLDRLKHAWKEDMLAWPLLFRAWAFQEQCLSLRILYFTADEVVWQCRSFQMTERGYTEMIDESIGRDFELQEPVDHCAEWYRTVESYSSLGLTYEKDRFPALAALAERMLEERTKDRFLAGLWETTLLHDLTWRIVARTVQNRDIDTHLPSWSWASYGGSVEWPISHEGWPALRSVTVMGIKYETRGNRLTDDLFFASITLEAPLLKLNCPGRMNEIRRHRLKSLRRITRSKWTVRANASQEVDDKLMGGIKTACYWDDFWNDWPEESEDVTSAHILPLVHLEGGVCAGLLLQQSKDGTHKRLGYVEVWYEDELAPWRKQSPLPVLENLSPSTVTLV